MELVHDGLRPRDVSRARPLAGFVRRWRHWRRAVRLQRRTETATAQQAIQAAFTTWQAALEELTQCEAAGWADPQYAVSLRAERRAFREFAEIQSRLRQRALPVMW